MIKKNKFIHKCICDWSKNGTYGFVSHTDCPVHGKEAKKMLKNTVNYKEKK